MRSVALLTVLSALLLSCGGGVTSRSVGTERPLTAGSIAVLPFENLSGAGGASEKITDYFLLNLQARRHLSLVEFGDTYDHLRRYRIRSSGLLTSEQIDSLALGMGIGFILTGTVLEYREIDNHYLGKVPQLSFTVRFIDCRTRSTVWSSVANLSGDQGELLFGIGTVRSIDALTRSAVDQSAAQLVSFLRKQSR